MMLRRVARLCVLCTGAWIVCTCAHIFPVCGKCTQSQILLKCMCTCRLTVTKAQVTLCVLIAQGDGHRHRDPARRTEAGVQHCQADQ